MPDGPGGWGLPQRSSQGGSGLGGVLREFHVPWPACNQDAARQAADAWTTLANAVDEISAACGQMVASIAANNSGKAIDAFAASWQTYGGKTGTLTLSAEACRAIAKACNSLADQVSEVKTEIEHKAEELVAAVAAAAIALIFTWGASVMVAEATGVEVAAWVTSLMATLSEQVGAISITLADAIGMSAPAVGAISGAAAEGAAANAVRGTFAAAFNEIFDTTLNAANGEPQKSIVELAGETGHEIVTSALVGIIAEAVPMTAKSVTSPGIVNEVPDFSPQVASAIMSSAEIAELLDTPAGKAVAATGGVTALHSQGMLDETETTAKTVESSIEGILNQITTEGGE
jgi:hypothetical protein